jgi:excisionase family DNA binding protein
MSDEARPEYLTIREAAAALRVNRKTVAGMISRGELAAVRVGRHWRIPLTAMPGQPTPPTEGRQE